LIYRLWERCYNYISMKQKIIVILVLAFGLLMVLPQSGHAWYHHYPIHHHGHHYSGWVPAAIIAGAFLTTAIIVSATNQNAQSSYQQPPPNPGPSAYCPPPPPPTSRPSVAPNPTSATPYPAGEWVAVPGQWVGNTWVPYHTVFVPRNP
jgi:hypothetical protein